MTPLKDTLSSRSNAIIARLGIERPLSPLKLAPELTRFFVSDVVEDRAKILARENPIDQFRKQVVREYSTLLEQALAQELKSQMQAFPKLTELAFLNRNLEKEILPRELTDHCFASRQGFHDLITKVRTDFRLRRLLLPGPLKRNRDIGVASVWLRAVQETALVIVRNDYPAKGKATVVPESTQNAVRKLLLRLDEMARVLEPVPPLKPLSQAELELRLLVSQAMGSICLPLRPIPTAPLSEDHLDKHYVGRPDEDARRLARQIRRDDGTILITGYRGVGKSSFVNRVMRHALSAQAQVDVERAIYPSLKTQARAPADGWLLVPVTVNLAKVSGVRNILRITLRAVRDTLLTDTLNPRPIPGVTVPQPLKSPALPLDYDSEIVPLQEAYIRATLKVTQSQATGDETKWEMGSAFSFDPGKAIAPLTGFELGKFLSAGVSKARTRRVNRELSLLDYDENSAEDDLARLIRSLANPRPLSGRRGPMVRIKLIFIFDELDKMDPKKGLTPMIEGLKNLFLQQHSVFVLVTSKQFYYDLISDRAKEDSVLTSYFSGIVHVPLLTFAQARKMVEDWIDWNATDQGTNPSPAEAKLLDQLTRLLVYRSFGNPRDIIRELRQMQEWADAIEQPYLTDRLAKSPVVQIFAAMQEAIEKAAVPRSISPSSGPEAGSGVALVSERLVGDESRLEQVRRGLYILTEELIKRGTLGLDDASLAPIKETNFSLLSVPDVRQLATRLGFFLGLLHTTLPPEVFASLDSGRPFALFLDQSDEGTLKATDEFYALTGRQASGVAKDAEPKTETRTDEQLIADAEDLAGQPGWAARLSAIGIIQQLGSKLTPSLKEFLLTTAQEEKDGTHRLAAVERLSWDVLLGDPNLDLTKLLSSESDDRVLYAYLIRLKGVSEHDSDHDSRKRVTDAIADLLKPDPTAPTWRLTGDSAVVALTVLKTTVDRDITVDVLEWLCSGSETEPVQTTAWDLLTLIAERFRVDLADRIISEPKFLKFFLSGSWALRFGLLTSPAPSALEINLRRLLSARPLDYAVKLLPADSSLNVSDLLTAAWEAAYNQNDSRLADFIFTELAKEGKTIAELVTLGRLTGSLRKTADFKTRLLPYLKSRLDESAAQYSEEQLKKLKGTIDQLEVPQSTAGQSGTGGLGTLVDRTSYLDKFTSRASWEETYRSYQPHSPSLDAKNVALLLGSLTCFILAVLFYKRNLPEGASVARTLASRSLLFLADMSLASPVAYSYFEQIDSLRSFRMESAETKIDSIYSTGGYRQHSTDQSFRSSIRTVAALLTAGAFFYAHQKLIAPLTYSDGVLQFFVLLPSVVLAYFAFSYRRP